MIITEIVQEWLDKAEEDFGFASLSLAQTEYFPQISFHFQQAAEKYLKAYIIAHELAFRPVHHLLELLHICRAHDPGVREIEEACRYLNPVYIDTRYPVHWPTHYDRAAAEHAKASAETIRDWILKALFHPAESEPPKTEEAPPPATPESCIK